MAYSSQNGLLILDKKKTDKFYSHKNSMKDAAKTYNDGETCTAKMRELYSK